MSSALEDFRYLFKVRFWADLWKEIEKDDCWGMAASLSFYLLLAFFPFLIFLSALLGFVPMEPGFLSRMMGEMNRFLPQRTYLWMRKFTIDLVDSQSRGAVSAGVLLALWWASVGIRGMVGVLNRALTVVENRSYLKRQLLAMGVTILLSLFVITSNVLLIFGDGMFALLLRRITVVPYADFLTHVRFIYTVSRWILIITLLNMGIQIVYTALPAKNLRWAPISPGSAVACAAWLIGSVSFSHWVNQILVDEIYQRLWGSLGAVILLMIWLYLSSFSLLLGGEINSEVYRLKGAER